ncbi:MAG: co-chaperone GroES [Bacteroidales bacterium]|nr:co-chaperone GroES [Bacteroidales bacterium]
MNELQPVNQNVLLDISVAEQEHKTHWGIIIPESAKERQNVGKVIAISNVENSEIAIGDKVLYKELSGIETEFEGGKYMLIQYSEIMAKIVQTDKI